MKKERFVQPLQAVGAVEEFFTTPIGRLSIGLLTGIGTVLCIWALYRSRTNLGFAIVAGVVFGWLAAKSDTPVLIRIGSLAAFLLLLFLWDSLGRLIIPQ